MGNPSKLHCYRPKSTSCPRAKPCEPPDVFLEDGVAKHRLCCAIIQNPRNHLKGRKHPLRDETTGVRYTSHKGYSTLSARLGDHDTADAVAQDAPYRELKCSIACIACITL